MSGDDSGRPADHAGGAFIGLDAPGGSATAVSAQAVFLIVSACPAPPAPRRREPHPSPKVARPPLRSAPSGVGAGGREQIGLGPDVSERQLVTPTSSTLIT